MKPARRKKGCAASARRGTRRGEEGGCEAEKASARRGNGEDMFARGAGLRRGGVGEGARRGVNGIREFPEFFRSFFSSHDAGLKNIRNFFPASVPPVFQRVLSVHFSCVLFNILDLFILLTEKYYEKFRKKASGVCGGTLGQKLFRPVGRDRRRVSPFACAVSRRPGQRGRREGRKAGAAS